MTKLEGSGPPIAPQLKQWGACCARYGVVMRLDVGDRAPAFTMLDAKGQKVSLSEFKGKSVIVYFYPAAMTPGCTTQACDFRDNLALLKKSGYVVLGISPDTPEKLAEFTKHDELNFTLLSDPDKKVLEKYGAYGEKLMYGKKVTGVIRSTFVVGPTGKIEFAAYNVKATGHVAKLMRDLEI